ncbi:precorrin-3B C(17)-methyltransferase [Mobilicoccus pelagius]|uniref:Precorrin-2 C20-methyltransferase/precorrin-3B C17-methyltransferase n=1 Tax=Mobilicoccus pelagius NBRC 104925 TaxID=1089455 RepID=H5UUX1_9MICO|nr:precorrin-3B C(17)-methyltransferase [Mobilicoccus pelagius]GAB49529.1 precorrin-2 C20-methyltransferase/precorrin-3B C17-methyltransferase [Mobilicoccus pelagius NBRC 104925]
MSAPAPATTTGRLLGVGVGPGDPRLLTIAAVDAIRTADVVAYHRGTKGPSNARGIVAEYLREGQIEEVLQYPVTTGTTDHPGGYRGAMDDFYTEAASRLAAHLDVGRTVALLAEGDPFMYSSYQHMHERLADRYPTTVIPGISSVTASGAALGRPLVEDTELLTVVPGTLPQDRLVEVLRSTDCAVVMKLGRTFGAVRQAIEEAGRLDDAWYAERVSMGERQHVMPLHEVDPEQVPYFSLAVIPSRVGAAPWMPSAARAEGDSATTTPAVSAAATENTASTSAPSPSPSTEAGTPAEGGYVEVIGLGPAGDEWRTPQAQEALARATDIVGYTTYVSRVPERPGLVKHDSDNKVESERAEFALDLAMRGHRVVVVSSGDAGVFGMATAVLEVAGEERYSRVPVRVVPGMTASHAVASVVGAPLGHDYATISLSDRLKPFDVVRERVQAAARADLVIAMYNPASKERRSQVAQIREDLLAIHAPETPVIVARAVGDPEGQRVTVTTLDDLDPEVVDMRTMLVVGSSQTRVDHRHGGAGSVGAAAPDGGELVAWTPRRYPEATTPTSDADPALTSDSPTA